MQYKISFINLDGVEFMGTMECFTTDGRYSLDTVHDIALRARAQAWKSNEITGYNVRLRSFMNPVVKTVLL